MKQNRDLAKRIQVYRANGRHARHVDQAEAICLLAGGCIALGHRGPIKAIRYPGRRDDAPILASAKRSRARDIRPRLPVQRPLTTTAEAFDNPPKVVKFQHLSAKHREIFASALCGRAGIIADPEAKREMRERIRAGE